MIKRGLVAMLASTIWIGSASLAQQAPRGPQSIETEDPTVRSHIATARLAAGARWADRLTGLCNLAGPPGRDGPPPRREPVTPVEVPNWPEAPAKVFDSVYFVGSKGVSAFAIDTPEGIIITDAMWAYDVERSVVDGLRTLGLDPRRIRYVIIPHGHPDHYGGAQFLHDRYGAKIVAPKGDLELIASGPKYDTTPIPKAYDKLVGDGDTLTLGGTTVTFTVMPGHTPGGVVMTLPTTLSGKRHSMLIWAAGGATPGSATSQTQQASALRTLIARTGASGVDAMADNHGSHLLVNAMKASPAGDNPFLIGRDEVRNYLTLRMECDLARAANSAARPLSAQ